LEFVDVLRGGPNAVRWPPLPRWWISLGGVRGVVDMALRYLRPVYEAIAERYTPGRTVLVAQSHALGARVASEKLGLPRATVSLCPAEFWSAHQPPVLPLRLASPRLPRWWARALYGAARRLTDRLGRPALNAFRAELGLPPVRSPTAWRDSPRRILAMFPAWFAPPQPAGPPQARLTGFPLYDERGVEALPAEAVRFLDAGEPPLVFTPGSADRADGKDFLAASAAACRLLGRRGLLLTRY